MTRYFYIEGGEYRVQSSDRKVYTVNDAIGYGVITLDEANAAIDDFRAAYPKPQDFDKIVINKMDTQMRAKENLEKEFAEERATIDKNFRKQMRALPDLQHLDLETLKRLATMWHCGTSDIYSAYAHYRTQQQKDNQLHRDAHKLYFPLKSKIESVNSYLQSAKKSEDKKTLIDAIQAGYNARLDSCSYCLQFGYPYVADQEKYIAVMFERTCNMASESKKEQTATAAGDAKAAVEGQETSAAATLPVVFSAMAISASAGAASDATATAGATVVAGAGAGIGAGAGAGVSAGSASAQSGSEPKAKTKEETKRLKA